MSDNDYTTDDELRILVRIDSRLALIAAALTRIADAFAATVDPDMTEGPR